MLFLAGITAIALIVNSCKKDSQNNIETLLTTNQWQLASVQVTHYLGSVQQGLTDTIGADCTLTEIFKFNADKTCTYSNFDCVPQNVSGHWALTSGQLVLTSDITVKESITTRDSTATGSEVDTLTTPPAGVTTVTVKPFATAQIYNLGQYSLVLKTGDLQSFYLPTQKRTITQYGFVRVKAQ